MLRSLFVAISLAAISVNAGIPKQAMRLEDVTTLVFTKNEMTASRRSSAVPQLSCVGGPCQYGPNSAMCRNIGFDGRDVTWKCEAELPKGVKFGPVHVSCEGYASKDDDLVLKGSCGLEYELIGQPRYDSEEKDDLTFVERHTRSAALGYPKSWWSSWFGDHSDSAASSVQSVKEGAKNAIHGAQQRVHHGVDSAKYGYDHVKDVSEGFLPTLSSFLSTLFSMSIQIIAFSMLMYFMYKFFCPSVSAPPPVVPQRNRGVARSLIGMIPFGGSAMSIFDALNPSTPATSSSSSPPSYQQATQPPRPQSKTFPSQPSQQSQQSQPSSQSSTESSNSGYGFLHGALGGAAAGYLLGRHRAPASTTTTTSSSPAPVRSETVRHVYVNEDRSSTHPRHEVREVYPAPESPKTRETTTAFATTRRR